MKIPHYWYWLTIIREADFLLLGLEGEEPETSATRLIAKTISLLPQRLMKRKDDGEKLRNHLATCPLCKRSLPPSLSTRTHAEREIEAAPTP